MAAKSETTMAAAETDVPAVNRKTAWFVLRAISGKEAKVKEVLDAAIRNTDLGKHVLQVLIPTEKVITTRNGKKVVKERNMYSGYVFVECVLYPNVAFMREDGKTRSAKSAKSVSGSEVKSDDYVEDTEMKPGEKKVISYVLAGECVDTLRNTTNVIDFLRGRSKQSEPQMLRREEIERMLGMADELNTPQREGSDNYAVGDSVKITQGAFSGFSGAVKEVDTEKGRLTVEVKIFGRPTDVTLEYSEVERV